MKTAGELAERRVSGVCKHCFQYIIPVYQLLVHPVIGQFWQFTSTMSIGTLWSNDMTTSRTLKKTQKKNFFHKLNSNFTHASHSFLGMFIVPVTSLDFKVPNHLASHMQRQRTNIENVWNPPASHILKFRHLFLTKWTVFWRWVGYVVGELRYLKRRLQALPFSLLPFFARLLFHCSPAFFTHLHWPRAWHRLPSHGN